LVTKRHKRAYASFPSAGILGWDGPPAGQLARGPARHLGAWQAKCGKTGTYCLSGIHIDLTRRSAMLGNAEVALLPRNASRLISAPRIISHLINRTTINVGECQITGLLGFRLLIRMPRLVAITVRAFRALGMGLARLAGCDSLARKRPAQRTKARIPPEHASASIAKSRRERPPRQAASIVHFFLLQHLGRLGHLGVCQGTSNPAPARIPLFPATLLDKMRRATGGSLVGMEPPLCLQTSIGEAFEENWATCQQPA
jgi:hypothetical protein